VLIFQTVNAIPAATTATAEAMIRMVRRRMGPPKDVMVRGS
jgi:hypothetical protein